MRGLSKRTANSQNIYQRLQITMKVKKYALKRKAKHFRVLSHRLSIVFLNRLQDSTHHVKDRHNTYLSKYYVISWQTYQQIYYLNAANR